jgi:hypothetical protein
MLRFEDKDLDLAEETEEADRREKVPESYHLPEEILWRRPETEKFPREG